MAESRAPRPEIARSRAQLFAAAERLFEKQGLDFSLNELAHEAELGVATTYRRFPSIDDLVRAMLERAAESFETILDEIDQEPDGWSAVVGYLERAVATNNAHPIYPAASRRMAFIDPEFRPARHLEHRLQVHVARAQAEGSLRTDVTSVDIVTLMAELGVMTLFPEPARTIMSARQLRIVLAGLRAESQTFGDLEGVAADDLARLHALAVELPSSGRPDRSAQA